ncbi:MAG: hypothetical protein AAFV29_06785 [Myxococcota bacterium]
MNASIRQHLSIACLFVFATSTACLPRTTVVRERAPITLPVGKPLNPCERRSFLDLVPTTGFAQSQQDTGAGFGWVRIETREERQAGFSIYQQRKLLLLPEILPKLDEPELTELHLGRLEPIQAKKDVMNIWAWTTTAIGSASIGVLLGSLAALGTDSDATGPLLITGSALVTATLLTMIGVLVNRPSNQENNYYDLRQRLLIKNEDDVAAASRGVNRYNEQARARCAD